MGRQDGLAATPPGQRVYLWVTRSQQVTAGFRPAPYVSRLPAVLTHVSAEEAVKLGLQAFNVHRLYCPYWKTKPLSPGDQLTSILGPDGVDYVRSGKAWSIIGVTRDHGLGDLNGQVVIAREAD